MSHSITNPMHRLKKVLTWNYFNSSNLVVLITKHGISFIVNQLSGVPMVFQQCTLSLVLFHWSTHCFDVDQCFIQNQNSSCKLLAFDLKFRVLVSNKAVLKTILNESAITNGFIYWKKCLYRQLNRFTHTWLMTTIKMTW